VVLWVLGLNGKILDCVWSRYRMSFVSVGVNKTVGPFPALLLDPIRPFQPTSQAAGSLLLNRYTQRQPEFDFNILNGTQKPMHL